MQNCDSISAASWVNYMEREKCELRKMKRFQSDPSGVYSMLVLEWVEEIETVQDTSIPSQDNNERWELPVTTDKAVHLILKKGN